MTEAYFTVAEATERFPTRPKIAAVWRWMTDGVVGPGRTRVYLGSLKCGGRRLIAQHHIDQFLADLNPEIAQPEPVGIEVREDRESPESVSARQRRSREARQALAALGCG